MIYLYTLILIMGGGGVEMITILAAKYFDVCIGVVQFRRSWVGWWLRRSHGPSSCTRPVQAQLAVTRQIFPSESFGDPHPPTVISTCLTPVFTLQSFDNSLQHDMHRWPPICLRRGRIWLNMYGKICSKYLGFLNHFCPRVLTKVQHMQIREVHARQNWWILGKVQTAIDPPPSFRNFLLPIFLKRHRPNFFL